STGRGRRPRLTGHVVRPRALWRPRAAALFRREGGRSDSLRATPPRHPGDWDNEGQADGRTGAALTRQRRRTGALTPSRGFVAPRMTGTPGGHNPPTA